MNHSNLPNEKEESYFTSWFGANRPELQTIAVQESRRIKPNDDNNSEEIFQLAMLVLCAKHAQLGDNVLTPAYFRGICKLCVKAEIGRRAREGKRRADLDVAILSAIQETPLDASYESALEECHRALGPDERAVVSMRIDEQASYVDIARKTQESEGTLRSRFQRALAKLKKCISQKMEA